MLKDGEQLLRNRKEADCKGLVSKRPGSTLRRYLSFGNLILLHNKGIDKSHVHKIVERTFSWKQT